MANGGRAARGGFIEVEVDLVRRFQHACGLLYRLYLRFLSCIQHGGLFGGELRLSAKRCVRRPLSHFSACGASPSVDIQTSLLSHPTQ